MFLVQSDGEMDRERECPLISVPCPIVVNGAGCLSGVVSRLPGVWVCEVSDESKDGPLVSPKLTRGAYWMAIVGLSRGQTMATYTHTIFHALSDLNPWMSYVPDGVPLIAIITASVLAPCLIFPFFVSAFQHLSSSWWNSDYLQPMPKKSDCSNPSNNLSIITEHKTTRYRTFNSVLAIIYEGRISNLVSFSTLKTHLLHMTTQPFNKLSLILRYPRH